MSYCKKEPERLLAFVAFCLTCLNVIAAIKPDEIEYQLRTEPHLRKPRFVRIYSKPPGEDAEKRTDLKFRDHLHNALKGGSVGLEFDFKPMKKKFSGLFDTVQKFLPSVNKFKGWDYGFKPKSITVPPSHVDKGDEDFESRSHDYSDENAEISAEFDLDPRIQLDPEPKRLVEMERERLKEP